MGFGKMYGNCTQVMEISATMTKFDAKAGVLGQTGPNTMTNFVRLAFELNLCGLAVRLITVRRLYVCLNGFSVTMFDFSARPARTGAISAHAF